MLDFFLKKKGKGQFSPIFPQYLNNVTRNLLPNKPWVFKSTLSKTAIF